MTLSCSSTDFENDSDFRPSRARCCLRFRLCRSIRCVYRLLITCSFPFRRDSYSGQPSVIHITTSKGDSRLIRRPSVAIVRSPNTCASCVFGRLLYALISKGWRVFALSFPFCSSFWAPSMSSLPVCMLEFTHCGLIYLCDLISCLGHGP